jgi:enamine deaminase RidA (YjgF/YER057c/UK114 family)
MSIERKRVSQRMSQIVVHGDTVYLAGMVALDRPGASVAEQTRDTLRQIDIRLAEAGTDKSRLLTAVVWLTDIETFDEMNAVWDAWVSPGNTPARACVEAKLAGPANAYAVEIMVTAALPQVAR